MQQLKPDKRNLPLIFENMSNSEYHRKDKNCLTVSSSMIRSFMNTCPAKWWHDYKSEEPQKHNKVFDFGSAAHSYILEKENFLRDINVIDFPNFMTKEAKKQRDQALEQGKSVILRADFDELKNYEKSLHGHDFAAGALKNGKAEISMFWRDSETGLTCKCRPDYITDEFIVDYKTTSSCHPESFKKSFYDYGYDQQAAWYIDGVYYTTGKLIKDFLFIVQEKETPYLVNIFTVSQEVIERGGKLNREYLNKLAECYYKNNWPGYSDQVIEITQSDCPPWTRKKYENILGGS